ncbi:MAG TPA: DNA polymerase III subunit chi [Usitatibacteraceae bacterium]|nr:DNA polymerase III subunit chi [Usitatibacteraceae bacterium]
MTDIKFFSNVEAKLPFACRWSKKACDAGRKLVVFAPDAAVADQFDRLLWTFAQLSFVPHVRQSHPLAAVTPIVIAGEDGTFSHADTVLNLGNAVPPFFDRFAALREIISIEETDRQAGRERYRHYQSLGFSVANENMAGK